MRSSVLSRYFRTFLLAVASLFLLATPALAAKPQLDDGKQISTEAPFKSAQVITNPYSDKAVYGKLEGDIPIDIYSFTPDHDGEQTLSLLIRPQEQKNAAAVLILMDPTNATQAREIGLPTPSDDYHTALIDEVSKTYNETALFTQFAVVSEQHIKLQKDKTYYLVVIDQNRAAVHYAVKFGDGKAWTAKDFFSSFGSWIRIKSDMYAGTGPFKFDPSTIGLLVFLLGLFCLIGTWVLQETFFILANRSKAGSYLLIKMQNFSRFIYWGALWFVAVGGYIYFHKAGWFGLPFVMGLIFIPIVLVLLYESIVLAPQLMRQEVSKKEASIPLGLRKQLFITFVLALLSFGSFITLLSMYFTAK